MGGKSCFINIFTRTFRTDDKICPFGKFFLSISVTICTLIIGALMGAIGAVVACYRLCCDFIVSLRDFHRGCRLCIPPLMKRYYNDLGGWDDFSESIILNGPCTCSASTWTTEILDSIPGPLSKIYYKFNEFCYW